VNCQTYVLLSAGVIFLGFGATEWSRDLAISYFKHLLGIGIKQFVLLLLASIALDILKTMDGSHTSSGWTPDLADLSEIYAGLTSADQSMSRAFLQELITFKEGTGPAPAELRRILHLEHPAAPDFDLVDEGTADGQSRSVRVHVTQRPDDRLFLQFSDLGGPSQSFFSHNHLLIGPGQREFLRFQDTPGSGGKVLTSVVLVTTSKQ
jgi:hypothetical protein